MKYDASKRMSGNSTNLEKPGLSALGNASATWDDVPKRMKKILLWMNIGYESCQ